MSFETKRRLTRSTKDAIFAGVCGGIAEYMELDSTAIRVSVFGIDCIQSSLSRSIALHNPLGHHAKGR